MEPWRPHPAGRVRHGGGEAGDACARPPIQHPCRSRLLQEGALGVGPAPAEDLQARRPHGHGYLRPDRGRPRACGVHARRVLEPPLRLRLPNDGGPSRRAGGRHVAAEDTELLEEALRCRDARRRLRREGAAPLRDLPQRELLRVLRHGDRRAVDLREDVLGEELRQVRHSGSRRSGTARSGGLEQDDRVRHIADHEEHRGLRHQHELQVQGDSS
mmetsp:Transcript_40226/g.115604  ORF Transcript_40226/g.115604 Transcript_40226/m.115604 type:complete len:215 (-) Transcript_40226:375-1019(-)